MELRAAANFWGRRSVEEGAYPQRSVTDEQRRLAQKDAQDAVHIYEMSSRPAHDADRRAENSGILHQIQSSTERYFGFRLQPLTCCIVKRSCEMCACMHSPALVCTHKKLQGSHLPQTASIGRAAVHSRTNRSDRSKPWRRFHAFCALSTHWKNRVGQENFRPKTILDFGVPWPKNGLIAPYLMRLRLFISPVVECQSLGTRQ